MEVAHDSTRPVIVRVKRKSDQSPLQALWLEINERPLKRPLLDFQKLSIAASTSAPPSQEELKIRRVLVQHVETISTSQATIDFLHSFVGPTSHSNPRFKASSRERKRALQKENKHDQLLSKAKQDQEDLAKNARFEQVWKRRGGKETICDESVGEVCRVYDLLRVDIEDTSRMVKQQEVISWEDQETLNKFLPLLRECIPSAAKEIESDINSHSVRQDPADEYVYDLYAVKEKSDEMEEAISFPLVQVEDDDVFYDGPDDSDYDSDDSNAENYPLNDYPEEESSDNNEEESERSGNESEEVESDTESDSWIRSDVSECPDRFEDPLCEDEINDVYNDPNQVYLL